MKKNIERCRQEQVVPKGTQSPKRKLQFSKENYQIKPDCLTGNKSQDFEQKKLYFLIINKQKNSFLQQQKLLQFKVLLKFSK
ncbi:hypothetical protein pb186bvf_012647 [Paramecium bursaria]